MTELARKKEITPNTSRRSFLHTGQSQTQLFDPERQQQPTIESPVNQDKIREIR